MLDNNEKIAELVTQMKTELIELRRKIHQNPELGFDEVETAKLVTEYLKNLGLNVTTGIAKTGVLGILEGDLPGPVIALRADMDALPVTEKTDVEYASKVSGKMHACGHDAHTAILLGTAKILSQLKHELRGTVKFIFQPAEEGPGGALPMVEAGVLQHPKVDAVFGLHLWPDLQVGEIALGYGAIMAAPDEFILKIKGKGGHGSAPHETIDAIPIAAQVINGLQQIVSRKTIPTEPVVLSIGTIKGGYRHNIIADEVEMTGTIRTLNPEVRDEVPKWIEEITKGITSAFSADYEFEYLRLYPPVVNDPKMVEQVEAVATMLLGQDGIKHFTKPVMGGEDFAYFLNEVPGAFLLMGSKSGPETAFPLHHPEFNLDERALFVGVELLTNIVVNYS